MWILLEQIGQLSKQLSKGLIYFQTHAVIKPRTGHCILHDAWNTQPTQRSGLISKYGDV